MRRSAVRRCLLELPLSAPGQDGLAQDVVEDLVAAAVPVGSVDRPHDALPTERREHRQQELLVDGCVLGEIAGSVCDLGARRRHEVAEDVCRQILLVR